MSLNDLPWPSKVPSSAFQVLDAMSPEDRHITAGAYAVVGAAAMAAGVTRTVSCAVIVFELTGQLNHMLPMLVAVLTAYGVGNQFNQSIYDTMLELNNLMPAQHRDLTRTPRELRHGQQPRASGRLNTPPPVASPMPPAAIDTSSSGSDQPPTVLDVEDEVADLVDRTGDSTEDSFVANAACEQRALDRSTDTERGGESAEREGAAVTAAVQ